MVKEFDIDEQLKALGDPVRMRIVRFLSMPLRSRSAAEESGGFCACDIESVMGVGQSTVSHHMKQLLQCGLVHSEKKGRWVYYRLNQPAFANLAQALARFAGDEAAAAACCGPATQATPAAPQPAERKRLRVVTRNKQA